jgi:hypothetical protein
MFVIILHLISAHWLGEAKSQGLGRSIIRELSVKQSEPITAPPIAGAANGNGLHIGASASAQISTLAAI